MSLFGYPADVVHRQFRLDAWGRPTNYYKDVPLKAKVVEEQKLIKNAKGEEVQSSIEIHLEGAHFIRMNDIFIYDNHRHHKNLGENARIDMLYIDFPPLEVRPIHIEIKKILGTDEVKKLIIYG